MSKAKDPFIGRRIREYEILGIIGRGGMGAVYRARHVYLDKERAIKVIHGRLAGGQDFVNRFIREAKILSELDHPNLVHFYEFGQLEEEMFFMVMEMIHGETVIERIQSRGRLPVGEAFKIIREAAMGLASAHQKGIIHRDISPDNLLIVRDSRTGEITKVVDFGIAKPLLEDTGKFTVTNFFIGKPEYSSPEQCGLLDEGEKIDHRSDIYSLAVTLHQMLTARLPFYASTPQGYILKHAHESPKPPSLLVPSGIISSEMDQFLLKALAKRREDRFSSMDEFIRELDEICSDESPTISRMAPQEGATDATLFLRREGNASVSSSDTLSIEDDSETERVQAVNNDSFSTPTTPLKRAPKASSFPSSILWILLALVLTGITAGAGFFFYQKYYKNEERWLIAAEKSVEAKDPDMAERHLDSFVSAGVPGYEERVDGVRKSIDELRYAKKVAEGEEILKVAVDRFKSGQAAEATKLLEEARQMNLPELTAGIDSIQREIVAKQTDEVRQQESKRLFDEIEKAVSNSELKAARQKIAQFRSSGYTGFEASLLKLEQKIQSIESQQKLESGEKILKEAQLLMNSGNLEEASQKIDQADALQIPELSSRIESMSARINSLEKQKSDPAYRRAEGLLKSARLLIANEQYAQAAQWIRRARELNVRELEPEITKLNAQLRSAVKRNPEASLDLAEGALKRGDWVQAQRIVRVLQTRGSTAQQSRIDQLNSEIDKLRPFVGFGVKKRWTDADRKTYGVDFGAVVGDVQANSPADRAGIRKGDVILEYDGIALSDEEQLPWLGAYAKPGSIVTLLVLQNNARRTIRLQVESMANR